MTVHTHTHTHTHTTTTTTTTTTRLYIPSSLIAQGDYLTPMSGAFGVQRATNVNWLCRLKRNCLEKISLVIAFGRQAVADLSNVLTRPTVRWPKLRAM